MSMIPEYTRGKIANLGATFSLNGEPINPSDLKVTIYYQGTIKVPADDPILVTTGQYYKEISIAEDWDIDYYHAIWTGIIGGIPFRRIDIFKIIEQETQTGLNIPTDSYCVVSDVLDELSGVDASIISNYNDLLARRIILIENRVNAKTHRIFKSISTTSYLDGSGNRTQQLPYFPILSVDSLTIRVTPNVDWWSPDHIVYTNCRDSRGTLVRTPSTDAEVKLSNLIVDCVNGELMIPERILYAASHAWPFWNYTFLEGIKNIVVSWTYGYTIDTRPDDIRSLAAKMTARWFLQQYGDKLSGGASGLSTDGFGRNYPGIAFAGRLERLDNEINEILDTYRQIGVN